MCSKTFLKLLLIISILNLISATNHSLLDSYLSKPTPLIKSYKNDLTMSLKSLYIIDDNENNFTDPSALLSKNCSSAFDYFSDAFVNFTRCAVKNARPVHICFECGSTHNVTVSAYNNLRKQEKDCVDFFFSGDQIAIVDVLYDDVTQLWSENYCDNCYQNFNLTQEFFNISNAFMSCVLNPNKTAYLPANATCEKCHDFYANLSNKYSLFVLSPGDYGKICMDVVDTMNLTRRIWKDYNCLSGFDYNLGYPNIIVALAIGVTPVLFYLLAKNISIIEDVKIVRPKRKFTPVSTIQPLKE